MRRMFTSLLLLTTLLLSETNTAPQHELNGNWHLRVIDGNDVRKGRAILDLNFNIMRLSGFDSCNRMNGTLKKNTDNNFTVPTLAMTRMACRGPVQTYVSRHLHTLLKEGFSITKEKKYGVEGITLKSPSHELFLKKMGE